MKTKPKRNKAFATAAGLLIVTLATGWMAFGARSESQRMDACIQALVSPYANVRARAEQDFHGIGTNALPVIARRLAIRASWFDPDWDRLAERWTWLPLRRTPIVDQHAPALKACYLLGPRAEPIIDRVAELLAVAPTVQVTTALSAMGPNAIRATCRTLGHADEETRYFTMLALAGTCHKLFTETAQTCGPLEASQLLREQVPEMAVPHLVRNLHCDDVRLRAAAAWTLGELRGASASAVPDLREALNDSEAMVREQARRALERIAQAAPVLSEIMLAPLPVESHATASLNHPDP